MERIEFLEEPLQYCNEIEFIVQLSKIESENELFSKLSDILKFPEYFGCNWNALYDCLRDFNWIEKKGIVLVHDEIPALSDQELRTYIEVLYGATMDWKEGEEHYFKVIFPKEAELAIKRY